MAKKKRAAKPARATDDASSIKTVFISSTYRDLIAHRKAVWDEIKRFKVAVRGMEEFGAQTASPLQTCLAELNQSQVYVGILGFRLGSVEPKSGKSFTQLEYEHAQELKLPTQIYLADEDLAIFPYKSIDKDSRSQNRLAAFKSMLREQHTVVTFSTPEDLATKIKTDFAKILSLRDATPIPATAEFEATTAAVKRFLLVPKTLAGREVRLKLRFFSAPFPASREICKAFNLEFGYTVGAHIRVDLPNDSDSKRFRQIYATSQRVDAFLRLAVSGGEADLYARLQFTEGDVNQDVAEFLGQSYYESNFDDGDPSERYIPPQGKMILLFTKDRGNAGA